jgi:hypothetical protein
VRLEGLGQLKKSSDLIGIRARDLSACSTVPQATELLRVQLHYWLISSNSSDEDVISFPWVNEIFIFIQVSQFTISSHVMLPDSIIMLCLETNAVAICRWLYTKEHFVRVSNK